MKFKNKSVYRLILVQIVLTSCSQYSQSDCEALAIKVSHGNTTLMATWNEHCTNVVADLTPDRCKEAFLAFAQVGNLTLIKERYGKGIERCFTPKDIELLNRNEVIP